MQLIRMLKTQAWYTHRHIREVDRSLASPPTFVDTSSYIANRRSRHKAHFDAVCGASVSISLRCIRVYLSL